MSMLVQCFDCNGVGCTICGDGWIVIEPFGSNSVSKNFRKEISISVILIGIFILTLIAIFAYTAYTFLK